MTEREREKKCVYQIKNNSFSWRLLLSGPEKKKTIIVYMYKNSFSNHRNCVSIRPFFMIQTILPFKFVLFFHQFIHSLNLIVILSFFFFWFSIKRCIEFMISTGIDVYSAFWLQIMKRFLFCFCIDKCQKSNQMENHRIERGKKGKLIFKIKDQHTNLSKRRRE